MPKESQPTNNMANCQFTPKYLAQIDQKVGPSLNGNLEEYGRNATWHHVMNSLILINFLLTESDDKKKIK